MHLQSGQINLKAPPTWGNMMIAMSRKRNCVSALGLAGVRFLTLGSDTKAFVGGGRAEGAARETFDSRAVQFCDSLRKRTI